MVVTIIGCCAVFGAYLSGLFHEYIPANHECWWTTYAMYLLRKWGRLAQQVVIHVKVMSGKGKWAQLELERRRKAVDKLRPSLPAGVDEEIMFILEQQLELRIFTPHGLVTGGAGSSGAILYFHGGGFVMCSVSMYRKFCANLALETGIRVFAVNYRKAPEYPFPCAQLDAFDTAVYLYDNCKALNLDVNRLVFAGDSAGGQLVINCWYRLIHSKCPLRPVGLSLVYPALGYSFDTPSTQRSKNYPPLTLNALSFYVLSVNAEEHDSYQYRLLAKNEQFDDDDIAPELRARANPSRYLTPEERADWRPMQNRKVGFTEEERRFRKKVAALASDPNFVPLFIPDADLALLPPVRIFAAEHDVLLNDAQMLHARLIELNCDSELTVWTGTLHACLVLSKYHFGLEMFKNATKAADEFFQSTRQLLD